MQSRGTSANTTLDIGGSAIAWHSAYPLRGIATAFGCSLQGQVPEREVVELAGQLVKAGADTIYVADTDNGRIVTLSATGEVQNTWGSEGKAVGQLKYPEAVAVDTQGAVYVADRGNDRLQVLRP